MRIPFVEQAGAVELARHWAEDPACAVAAAELPGTIEELTGSPTVAMYRCADCGLEMAVPGGTWSSATYPRQGYYLAFDHQEALRRLGGLPAQRLLELGCGDGQFLEQARRLGHRAVGLDFSRDAVRAARERGMEAHLGDVSAVSALIAEEGVFDVVALFQILEHVADPDALLADLARVTRPGSLMMIGVPAPRRFSRAVGHAERVGSSDYWDWPPQHALRWNERALRTALARNSWEVEEVRAEPFSLRGAAATLAAISGRREGWYGSPMRRRLGTASFAARLAAARLRGPVTGIRLFVAARRVR